MLAESIASAASSVFGSKTRSILTMLGIVIGISSVIMISSIGRGFQESVNSQFAKMGAASLQITVKYDTDVTAKDLLNLDDVDIVSSHPRVKEAAPLLQSTGKIQLLNPEDYREAYILGCTGDLKSIQTLDMRQGRFLAGPDVSNSTSSAVIDSNLAQKAFGSANPIGKTIQASMWFGTAPLTVVGVYKSDEFGANYFELPSIIYVPITTLMKMDNVSNIDAVYANVDDRGSMERISLEISKLLSLSHRNEDKYSVQNLLDQMDAVNTIVSDVTGFVSLIAAISLFVGGIGVMNIMLVTVTERTREIGIRKSLGATDWNIQLQFLVEAVILTATGGLIGIGAGILGGTLLGSVIDVKPSASISNILAAVLIAGATGIAFGVYPARKAAKLDPIEALRYE
ncbi:MAG: ABC transporter permease [Clostridiales bacterium]|jgi:putative ABC transport system permease protein|nr:ABC transporter permease [Clostridiales bacterium]